jgi:hypothetical protein
MKDREWRKKIEDEITYLKKRVEKLDGNSGCKCRSRNPEIIELDIKWPEADIGGLHFNAQEIHGVFELKEDGNYYSRDILFHSARDTDEGTGRDLLSEYLDSEDVREAFLSAIGYSIAHANGIHVFLPKETQGVKKYNGVTCWYWLHPRLSVSAANFCDVDSGGTATGNFASAVGGCSPAFCVA